jgi:hypothetical protein
MHPRLVILNREPTPLDPMADLVSYAAIGENDGHHPGVNVDGPPELRPHRRRPFDSAQALRSKGEMMTHDHQQEDGHYCHHDEDAHARGHHHDCDNLFGCGDEKGTGIIREDIKDGAVAPRSADRLLHMDEVDQERFDGYLRRAARSSMRGRFTRILSPTLTFLPASTRGGSSRCGMVTLRWVTGFSTSRTSSALRTIRRAAGHGVTNTSGAPCRIAGAPSSARRHGI